MVKPLRPEANLFLWLFALGSGPFCVSGLLFLVAKRKSGWGILRVVRLGCVVFGSSQFTYFVGPFGSLYKMFYCLCSCKNRARERHRPYSRKEKSAGPSLQIPGCICNSPVVNPWHGVSWLTGSCLHSASWQQRLPSHHAVGVVHVPLAPALRFSPSGDPDSP